VISGHQTCSCETFQRRCSVGPAPALPTQGHLPLQRYAVQIEGNGRFLFCRIITGKFFTIHIKMIDFHTVGMLCYSVCNNCFKCGHRRIVAVWGGLTLLILFASINCSAGKLVYRFSIYSF
jgi:hypothetical protein